MQSRPRSWWMSGHHPLEDAFVLERAEPRRRRPRRGSGGSGGRLVHLVPALVARRNPTRPAVAAEALPVVDVERDRRMHDGHLRGAPRLLLPRTGRAPPRASGLYDQVAGVAAAAARVLAVRAERDLLRPEVARRAQLAQVRVGRRPPEPLHVRRLGRRASPKTARFTATIPLIVVITDRSTLGTIDGWQADWPQRCTALARLPAIVSMPACARPLSQREHVAAVARRAPDGLRPVRVAEAGDASVADEAALGTVHHDRQRRGKRRRSVRGGREDPPARCTVAGQPGSHAQFSPRRNPPTPQSPTYTSAQREQRALDRRCRPRRGHAHREQRADDRGTRQQDQPRPRRPVQQSPAGRGSTTAP